MDLTISGRHVAVTDAMRDHARQRAQKLEHFSSHLKGVSVTLTIEGDRHQAEIVAGVRTKGEVVARAESHDMYASIDQAVARIEKQLQKMEARFKDRRGNAKSKRQEGAVASEPEEASEGDE